MLLPATLKPTHPATAAASSITTTTTTAQPHIPGWLQQLLLFSVVIIPSPNFTVEPVLTKGTLPSSLNSWGKGQDKFMITVFQ